MNAVITGVGCDLKCPLPDADCDGYTTSQDADDNNRMVYPGIQVSAGGGLYKTAQSDGTYGASGALTPGSHATYFIDCDNGLNTYLGDSFTAGHPWADARMISGGGGGSLPAGAVTLQAGDTVYWRGAGCAQTYSDGSQVVMAHVNGDGTLANPIKIIADPASTAVMAMNTNNAYGFWLQGDHIQITGGSCSGSAAPANPCIRTTASTGLVVQNFYGHGLVGNGNNNFGVLYLASPDNPHVHHNFFSGISVQNTTSLEGRYGIIVFYDSPDAPTAGTFDRNSCFTTRTTNSSCSYTDDCFTCFRGKHGILAAATTGYHMFEKNIVVWPRKGAYLEAMSKFYGKSNLIVDPVISAFYFNPDPSGAGDGETEDNFVEYNTVVNGQLLYYTPSYASTVEKVTARYNVAVDDANPFAQAASGTGGFEQINPYGSDSNYSDFNTHVDLVSDYNCFYAANVTVGKLDFFSVTTAQFATAGNTGAFHTCATWVSTAGFDTHSTCGGTSTPLTDPLLDTYSRATLAACQDYGWLKTSEEQVENVPGIGGGKAPLAHKRPMRP